MIKRKINVMSPLFSVFPSVSQLIITSNNQTLQSADDKFYKTDGQNTRDQISRGRRSKRV